MGTLKTLAANDGRGGEVSDGEAVRVILLRKFDLYSREQHFDLGPSLMLM